MGSVFLFYHLRLSQVAKHRANIGIEQDGLLFKTLHGDGLAQIDADVGGLGILRRHMQERHFDDAGGIAADAQLQAGTVAGGQQEPIIEVTRPSMMSRQYAAHSRRADYRPW